MYNLNVNVSTSASSLAVESSCTTPKTPEILNSLIAMSSPFDSYPSGPQHHHGGPRVASSPPEGESFAHPGCSSMPPPSVQHTCSQLIKEGLKLTLQSKRKLVGADNALDSGSFCKIPKLQFTPPGCGGVGSSGDDEVSLSSPESSWLTAEDAERRRRRRERNKIAATKCRLKKREKTVILVQESEVLENQNHDLKSQIQDLENQRRRLMDMLSMHNQTCVKNVSGASTGHHYVPPSEHHHLPPQQQQQHHSQQQQQQHYVTPGYQHYPSQESPPTPGPYPEVSYSVQQQQSGMDSGCLA